jgi:hypothetical protein
MSVTNEFYRNREAEARREAADATLDNVRDRHLHAASAWAAMAVRGEKTERRRAETDARKAAERAAEALMAERPAEPAS